MDNEAALGQPQLQSTKGVAVSSRVVATVWEVFFPQVKPGSREKFAQDPRWSGSFYCLDKIYFLWGSFSKYWNPVEMRAELWKFELVIKGFLHQKPVSYYNKPTTKALLCLSTEYQLWLHALQPGAAGS